MNYLINKTSDTYLISAKGHKTILDIKLFENALLDTDLIIKKIINDIPVDIFSILGMRNLSAFIGELFARSIANNSKGLFINNPHQDGYPDLLLMDEQGQKFYNELTNLGKLRDKAPFSPFANGGLEVKATCGAVPTPKQCAKKGLTKPDMGDTRIALLSGYDWKAHHRETNNLIGLLWDFQIGLLWDFQNSYPEIVAIFFGNGLTETDWGEIIQPKKGGGRTTSVSIMTRAGVAKMYQNWILVKNDERYINFLNRYNRANLISNKI